MTYLKRELKAECEALESFATAVYLAMRAKANGEPDMGLLADASRNAECAFRVSARIRDLRAKVR